MSSSTHSMVLETCYGGSCYKYSNFTVEATEAQRSQLAQGHKEMKVSFTKSEVAKLRSEARLLIGRLLCILNE